MNNMENNSKEEPRLHLLKNIYHDIFINYKFSISFYKIFLPCSMMFSDCTPCINYLRNHIFEDIIEFILANYDLIDGFRDELADFIKDGIEHFEKAYTKIPIIHNLLDKIGELFLHPTSNHQMMKSFINITTLITKVCNLLEGYNKEILYQFYHNFTTKLLTICSGDNFFNLIKSLKNSIIDDPLIVNAFDAIIDYISFYIKQLKDIYNQCTELSSIKQDICNMLSKKLPISIRKVNQLFFLLSQLFPLIKQLLLIIKKSNKVESIRDKIIDLLQAFFFEEFGTEVNKTFQNNNPPKIIFNPFQPQLEFIKFYEDEDNLLLDYFLIDSDTTAELFQSKSMKLKNFFWLVHFHPNPFIFKVLQNIQFNVDILRKLLMELFNEFDNLINTVQNHNACYFVNIINLYSFVNSFCFNKKELWDKNLLQSFVKLYKYLRQIQFTNFQYICFIVEKNEKEIKKKTIIEFLMDFYMFLLNNNIRNKFFSEIKELLLEELNSFHSKKDITIRHYLNQKSMNYLFNHPEITPEKISEILHTLLLLTKISYYLQLNSENEDYKLVARKCFENVFTIKDEIYSLQKNPGIKGPIQDVLDYFKQCCSQKTINENYETYVNHLKTQQKWEYNEIVDLCSSNFKLSSIDFGHLNEHNFNCNDCINIIDEPKITLTKIPEHIIPNNINDIDFYIIFPKSELLLSSFGVVFKKTYFHNDLFITLKNYYHSIYLDNHLTKAIDYPTKIKNFSNSEEPPLFLSQNMKFLDKQYFKITHNYITESLGNVDKIKQIKLYKTIITHSFSSQIECEIITTQNVYRGIMFTHSQFLYFTTSKKKPSRFVETEKNFIMCSITKEIDTNLKKTILIRIKDIKEIVLKRFAFIKQAYEIYLSNGKSYFINFYNTVYADSFIHFISTQYGIKGNSISNEITIINNCKGYITQKKYQSDWMNGKISTFRYLCILNKYSSRTFNDANQYYVFPWVIKNYDNFLDWDITNGEGLKNYRDLQYPPSVQDKRNKEKALEKYQLCLYENEDNKKKVYAYHFGSHYSTSSFIYYYLMRMSPFLENLIKLQNYELEAADRMFTSINETRRIIINLFDNRELIPEFYSMMEYLINLNCCYLGQQSSGAIIDDLKLNDLSEEKKIPTLQDYIHFFTKNKVCLEFVAQRFINKWIDIIFGVNQFLPKKKELLNLFPKSTYKDKNDWENRLKKYEKCDDCEKAKKLAKIQEKKSIVLNFGQTPMKLFDSETPQYTYTVPESVVNKQNNDYFSDFAWKREKKIAYKHISDNSILYFISNITISKELQNCPLVFCKDRTIFIRVKATASEHKFDKLMQLPHLKLFNNKNKHSKRYRYCPKYAIAYLQCVPALISCRNMDNSFIIHTINQQKIKKQYSFGISSYKVHCESFVNSVCVLKENFFLTGLFNGKLIKWQYDHQKKDPKEIHSIFAHEDAITVIEFYERLNIIITGGEDHYVYIRKAETFELLTVIKTEYWKIPYFIRISEYNLIYVMSYCLKQTKYVFMMDYAKEQEKEEKKEKEKKKENKEKKEKEKKTKKAPSSKPEDNKSESGIKPIPEYSKVKDQKQEDEKEALKKNNNERGYYMITGYTLTGMKFANTNNMDISCFDFLPDGNLIIGFYQKHVFEIFHLHSLTKIHFSFLNRFVKINISSEKNNDYITWVDFPKIVDNYKCYFSTASGFFGGMTTNRNLFYKICYGIKELTKQDIEDANNQQSKENANESNQ